MAGELVDFPLREHAPLRTAAAAVLQTNDAGRYTAPSRATYPHQWNWDSALCALGWYEVDPARAWIELSAILARACLDLAWLAGQLGEPAIADESGLAAERVSCAVRARADADGLIRAVDLVDGGTLPPASAGSALALLTPGLGPRVLAVARKFVTHGALGSRFGVRSLDRDHPERSVCNYSAAALRTRLLCAVVGGGMREYFELDSARGLGAVNFSWTAALTLHELAAPTAQSRAPELARVAA